MEEKRKIFGTDGVRGVANVYPMTVEMAMAIGQGVAETVKKQKGRRRIVIGKDTRLSGYMFENALVSGILSMGVNVHLVGPLPTPAIAFITRNMRAGAGIVISASHNPYEDNGIKVFGPDGFKLPDEMEEQIEDYVLATVSGNNHALRPTATEIGKGLPHRRRSGALHRFFEKRLSRRIHLGRPDHRRGLRPLGHLQGGAGRALRTGGPAQTGGGGARRR